MKFKIAVLCIFCLFTSCSSSSMYINEEYGDRSELQPPSNSDLIYRVFLLGDAGASSLDVQEPVLRLFQSFLREAGERSAAIFLGDNIYMNGLPDSSHADRRFYEQRLIEQLKTVEDFPGRVIFIPGNHDWDDGGRDGLEAVKRQERFVEEYLDRGNTFLPDNGFPGPVSIRLMDDKEDPRLREDIRLIVLDTQWWLHRHEKPFGDSGEFEVNDAGDVLIELEDILRKQRKDYLLIAAHHPLVTHDNHGGYLHPSIHLKPPVIGSFIALYRRVFGLEQDVNHHRYSKLAASLRSIFRAQELEFLIYASGHSHGLQYHRDNNLRFNHHFLISGSGSKKSYIARGRGAEFTYGSKGFLTVQYYADGSVWLEAWAPEGDGSMGEMLYRNQLKPPFEDPFPADEVREEIPDINFADSTITMAPNAGYDGKSRLFEWIVGKHNRKYWSVEDEYPYFDITEIEGGLMPVRTGGKGQSTTLHMERQDGRDFVLRSVDKEAGRIWDENLRKTFALDLAQDQFSILNPYSAIIIPTLASAIGTFHTNPKIYYVPEDPMLGEYDQVLSGELALFEERPNGNMSDVASVGKSDDVLSSTELIRELDNDIDHRVDQHDFARNRLLDMILADWDRHSDQWRWASFEPDDEKGKIYRAIPRDRDVALMRMTGLIPAAARFMGPFFQYQNFANRYGNLKGLNFNSLNMTRRFTNQLTKEDWIEIAEKMQNSLSDEVIEEAVRNYPDEIFEKYGEETIELLKIRRDQLADVAARTYSMISGVVSVPGSNKRERFFIEILDGKSVRIQVYKLSGEGELRENYFDRIFLTSETDEIRLFGMGGDDQFYISGHGKSPIKIRITGGAGNDEYVTDNPNVNSGSGITIYESESGNRIETGTSLNVKLSDHHQNLRYNYRDDFRWNRTLTKFNFEYNSDDGLFLGGGPEFIRNGFRKLPASVHYVRANYAPKTGAANLRYNGTLYQVAGDVRAELSSHFLFPKSYRNFYGLGNETTLEDRSKNYYRARLYQYSVQAGLGIAINNILDFSSALLLRATNVDRDPDNIVTDPFQNIPSAELREQWFGGIVTRLRISDVDQAVNPKQGYRFYLNSDLNIGIHNTSEAFTRIASELEMYFSPRLNPQITIAGRTGTAHNFGDFPFYESNSLGGTTNLRGYNGRRFSGRTAFFNNVEIRMELLHFYRYLLGGKAGVTGFFDTGRVWSDREQSSKWHRGYGGGIWFNIFESFLLNSSIGFSEDGKFFTIQAGFLF
jgi:hypothetical protein